MAHACFPNVSHFPTRETLFQVSVFVFNMQIMLTLHGMCAQQFSEHEQATTHLIFASNSSEGQTL